MYNVNTDKLREFCAVNDLELRETRETLILDGEYDNCFALFFNKCKRSGLPSDSECDDKSGCYISFIIQEDEKYPMFDEVITMDLILEMYDFGAIERVK
jgi:hypothetical protein